MTSHIARPDSAMLTAIIFNLNDVVLLLTIFECMLFAALLLFINKGKRFSNVALSGFLLLNAMLALDTLLYWSIPINEQLSGYSPNVFFLLGFAHFLLGPALYWYTKSLIYRDYSVKSVDLMHLIPALLYPIYMYFIYYSQETGYKLSLVHNFDNIKADLWFELMVWCQHIAVVIYGFLCLHQLMRYRTHLKNNYSNIESIDLSWLKLLVVGFQITWIWTVIILFESRFTELNLSGPMSVAGNYMLLFLVNALVLYSLSQSDVFIGIQLHHMMRHDGTETIAQTNIDALKKAIAEDRVYLDPDITLEQLASRMAISPRLLSSILNRHFQQNFFEFINSYRIDEAKRLLLQQNENQMTILEIMDKVGFKTKSAFNRFFKRLVGITPSQYRDKHNRS